MLELLNALLEYLNLFNGIVRSAYFLAASIIPDSCTYSTYYA